jgi:hypothetical protein
MPTSSGTSILPELEAEGSVLFFNVLIYVCSDAVRTVSHVVISLELEWGLISQNFTYLNRGGVGDSWWV